MTNRHRLARTLLASALLATLAAPMQAHSSEAASEQRQPQFQFDIPSQPLLDALGEFTATTGIAVLRTTEEQLAGQAPAVRGRYTADQAMGLLLQGSGLSFRHGAGSITLERPSGDGTLDLSQIDISASGQQSAFGPVSGYVATAAGTATKTDTPIIETPQSISVVTRDQITDIHAQSLRDVLGYTAGVIATEADDRLTDTFVLRGFQISGSTFRDGMRYMSNIYDGTQEPYGMERVEVLRGASSVLFGQAAPGGIINVVSKLPTREELHEIKAETGSNDRHQLATDHGGALTDTLSYRFTALQRRSDTTTDHVPDDRTYIAPSLTWQPDDATSLTLLASYQKSRTAYVYGLPAEGTVLPNPNGHISRHTFTGEPGYDKSVITAWDIGYRFEHAFNDDLKVRQNLRYFESENDMPSVWLDSFIDPQMTTVARGAQDRVDDSRNFVVDTQLEARFHHQRVEQTVLAGVDYGDRHLQTDRYDYDLTPLNVFNPVYGGTFTARGPAPFSSRNRTRQSGIYLQDQIKFDEKWVLLLGGRQDWAKQKEDALYGNDRSRQDSDAFTTRVGLVYLADNGLAPFVSYSESFEPQAGRSRAGQDFDPTEGEQYEIGIRYQPPGSNALYSAALYQLTRSNVLTTDPVNTNFQVQTGEIRSRGLELEAKADIGSNASVTASYAYTQAEVTKSNSGNEGQKTGGMPRNMFSVWGDYRFGQVGPGELRAGTGVRYVDEVPGLFSTRIVAPSYTLVDAMLGYAMGPWDLTLNVTNLTDEDYLSYTYAAFYGAERQVTAGVAYRW
ncbi:TonB-dependent siderophore receptor [Pseudomonas sp. TUM22785]|uniref:TonB-dependent siderophore receptor n=1 Tax=Pseudomonas sp. TUM22785 TaxID=3019098 RepID=UPI00230533C7|nr:TonB-dependent siderophore receptor [Pseudomonas sp. TUM22785]WCD78484.1 TonB-dependent siderophore receptor [Pseudomonas sp. TUM22785]